MQALAEIPVNTQEDKMKKFFAIALFIFSFAITSFAAAEEYVPVEGSRIAPEDSGKVFGPPTHGGFAPRPCKQKDCGKAVDDSIIAAPGIRRACQECQSSSALYTCNVWKSSPVNETWDKTMISLSSQNCCAASGGRVLSTRQGSCG